MIAAVVLSAAIGLPNWVAGQAATGTLSGIVVVHGTDTPVRGAIVSVRSVTDAAIAWQITSDEEGRFQIGAIPAGGYTVHAARPGFVAATFGAAGPGRIGRVVTVEAGQTRIVIPMRRGGVIAGTVRSESGAPLAGVRVSAIRQDGGPGSEADAVTSRSGGYRLFGLDDGSYFVLADAGPDPAQGGPLRSPDGRPVVLPPAFHPMGHQPSAARPVLVEAGSERAGIDIQFRYVAGHTVSGSVHDDSGMAVRGAAVRLIPAFVTSRLANLAAVVTPQPSGADGSFTFAAVAPGEYYVVAGTGAPGARGTLWGAESIVVDGDRALSLTLHAAVTVEGRLATPASAGAGMAVIELIDADPRPGRPAFRSITPVKPGGTFAIDGVVPGQYRLHVPRLPGWSLSALTVSGTPHDGPWLMVAPGGGPLRVDVALVEASAGLIVTVEGELARVGPDAAALLFSTNDAHWWPGSDRVRTARAVGGRFEFRGMAPGEYSLAVLNDAPADDAITKDWLTSIRPAAVRVVLRDGETSTQAIRAK